MYIKGGSMDNPTRAKIMEANPHYFKYTWKRGTRRHMCENVYCPRRNLYDPVHWSKASLRGSTLQCAICEKLGVPKYDAVFCTKR
jgi:hypothetical protein